MNSFLEKIPRKDLWVCVSTEMCSHYWVTPPFDFITAHCITPYICPYYSSHNIHSICLCNCICTVQIVLVWVLVSNFIIQPTDFQPTFVHITLLRLHSICICTCICICLDRIHHHASKQNVCKSDWKNWVFSCRKRRWCSIFHSTCNVCPHLCPVATPYLHTHNLCISVFVICNFRSGLLW